VTVEEVIQLSEEIEKNGRTAYLTCERVNKQYNLGDTWATDRSSRKCRGNRAHRFDPSDSGDAQMLREAIARGCA
jgi:hypothetical protein